MAEKQRIAWRFEKKIVANLPTASPKPSPVGKGLLWRHARAAGALRLMRFVTAVIVTVVTITVSAEVQVWRRLRFRNFVAGQLHQNAAYSFCCKSSGCDASERLVILKPHLGHMRPMWGTWLVINRLVGDHVTSVALVTTSSSS
jgi:hypothetical protein